jgi:integrase
LVDEAVLQTRVDWLSETIGELKHCRYMRCRDFFNPITIGRTLLFATGAPVPEIANLKNDNIELNSGMIVSKGKGRKKRIIEIRNQETLQSLRRYYKLFSAAITKGENYFLINQFSKKLSDQSIRANCKKIYRSKRKFKNMLLRMSVVIRSETLLIENEVEIKIHPIATSMVLL